MALGTVCGHLVYFSHFGMFGPTQIWQPWGKVQKEGKREVMNTVGKKLKNCTIVTEL
jgi:hypothetical protein